ncbi:LmeA family phospholipid-binding protein [Phycicoccus sonneratiae]|uniref:LmeA family phospholipid-binding protein n=1 Tax=Phycicoccus sonneratiae TaxID=2807628 RepID=A0ABS2CJL8_9MICO|nr:LmeA family phospholipid-binding protein [Phycicoccus sonneraticus]MBM6400077.1 LmeA family phospholipid-binding protein [Phycicoccus sonneraticus]
MKRFLLGVVTTLAVLAVAAVALLLSLGSGGGASPSPSTAAPSVSPSAPADLAADETWLGTVRVDSADVVAEEGSLTDVRADGTGVRFGPDGLRAQRLDLTATLPFGTVAPRVGDGVRLFPAGNGLAGVERTATILGRDVTLRATGRVVASGGDLLIEPETVDLGGPSFVDSAASALARRLVTIRQDVPGAPDGMVLREVRVTPVGFAVRLDGADVTIGR